MKRNILSFAVIALMASCSNAPTADKAATTEQQTAAATEGTQYLADSTSTINWTGTKPTGQHKGTFTVKEGSFSVNNDNLTAGSFVINVAAMATDLAEAEGRDKLVGHLQSPDFFDVAKYPTAKFEITGVEAFKYDSTTMKDVVMKDATHTIKGNLTLKDSTKNISFPAKVSITADKITAAADFNIDRTLWGLNYKGPDNPQDWIIRKEVNLKLNITASKK